MNTLVFDIETVPDTDLGRRLYGLENLSDEQVAQIMFTKRRQDTGQEFLSHEQHRVVAISVVMRTRDTLKVWSLGEESSTEKDLIERFFDGLDKFTPDLVSWNGAGFDLPVLHYRSLLHSLTAARYWETGDGDSSFRYSNYLSRFHWRHMDLMDVLSGFQGRGRASLDDVATLLGFPGKIGMHGSQVWEVFKQGGLGRIRDYCETDVLNTYLVYLRFQLLRGHLNPAEHAGEVARVRTLLTESAAGHLREFAAAWPA
ncbi:MAG: Polysaccharide biosynthesis protein [Gammaproteobacteria bacterium]|nr:Polysaccharide biosynthesis protein [Gammaproteobacteria bacterium]